MKHISFNIIVLLLITIALYLLVTTWSDLIIVRDLMRAIGDVALELAITAIILTMLAMLGMIFSQWSLRQQRPKQRPMNLKMRLRMQRGKYPQIPIKENWWINFWQGISTELYGAFVTGIFLGMVVLVFQQYSAIQNRKADLILQMGSPDNSFAIEAVRQLQAEEWLSDGTLRNANLNRSNLANASILRTDLTDATLWYADLTNANITYSDFTNADLSLVDLREATLWETDLSATDLSLANLTNANLVGVILTESTKLPDNTFWMENTDMGRFTDPKHPEYWNPCVESALTPLYCD